MDKTIEYLQEYIDDNVLYYDCNSEMKKKLPLRLAGSFDMYKCTVLENEFIVAKPYDEITVSRLKTMVSNIEEKTGLNVALLLNTVTPYAIKKMLMDKNAFIVPYKQLYLPFLALMIKHEKQTVRRTVKKFSPGTQLVYLYTLYSKESTIEIETVTNSLSISKMTAFRGLTDLTELGLLNYDITGLTARKKIYHKVDMETYFKEGRKYLDDPVRETVYVSSIPENCQLTKTGLTALADQTMLAQSAQMEYALNSRQKAEIGDVIIPKTEAVEKNLPKIQLTKYDTGELGENGYADPVSLMLSIEEKDERIEMALDELFSKFKWYKREVTGW